MIEFHFSFKVDKEAWNELCELYLRQHDYTNAAFCAEELLLLDPHNHLNHERYASICYSQKNNETARIYYFSSLKLNPNNMRSLYGILLTSANLKSQSNVENGNSTIIEQIERKYRNEMPELLPFVDKTLQALKLK